MSRYRMSNERLRRWMLGAATALSALLLATPLAAQTGSVSNDGRFRLTGVPAGARQVRARSIGYQPSTATVTVANGASATVNLTMTASATALDAVVVTGAVGDTRRRAIGNAVASVNVDEVLSLR